MWLKHWCVFSKLWVLLTLFFFFCFPTPCHFLLCAIASWQWRIALPSASWPSALPLIWPMGVGEISRRRKRMLGDLFSPYLSSSVWQCFLPKPWQWHSLGSNCTVLFFSLFGSGVVMVAEESGSWFKTCMRFFRPGHRQLWRLYLTVFMGESSTPMLDLVHSKGIVISEGTCSQGVRPLWSVMLLHTCISSSDASILNLNLRL